MDNAEYRQYILEYQDIYQNQKYVDQNNASQVREFPAQLDWSKKGAVTPVQDQGSCKASWAFSTVSGLEGFNFAQNGGKLVQLSPQQLISCSTQNMGCKGGNILRAYSYAKSTGLQNSSSYPYVSGSGEQPECSYEEEKVEFKLQDYQLLTGNNPQNIQSALQSHTLSVGIDASSIIFQYYNKGVLDSHYCGNKINYAVTLVGYNDEAESPYWIIKNSVGTSWGQEGYGWIKKNNEVGAGMCGINKFVVNPLK